MALLQQFLRNQSSVLTHSFILKNKGFKTKEEKPENASKKVRSFEIKSPLFCKRKSGLYISKHRTFI